MDLLLKLKQQGLIWMIRRIFREFIEPTTTVGKRLKPFFIFVYYLLNKPINFLFYVYSLMSKSSKNSLYFFYDFEVEPITYDFIWALCIANARRNELGLSNLRIVFVPGTEEGLRKEEAEYEKIIDREARYWRIYSILLPAIRLLPCASSFMLCATRAEAMLVREQQAYFVYPEKYNVTFPVPYSPRKAMDYRQKFMALQADQQTLEYVSQWLSRGCKNKKIIVITLRQYAYSPARNSNIVAWAQFARTLDKERYYVVFVPDTEQALSESPTELQEFDFFLPACWNLNLRCGLYELAYLNLGVNNGPMALCWLNPRCRYITFKTSVETVPQASTEVLLDRGFVLGENPQFTNKFQKWVWEDDDLNVISREFEQMCDVLNEGVR